MRTPSPIALAAAAGTVLALTCLIDAPLRGGATAEAAPAKKGRRPVRVADVLRKADGKIGSGNLQIAYDYQRDRVEPGDDRTLAPYFYVSGGDPATDRLPLKETTADVRIAGVIARVKVRQVFANDGSKPIEAVYVFPGSTRAAVHGMRMRIGERTIEAQIDDRKQARQRYEQAREEGKRASLLEQERPNVFTMSVANIMPRDRIEVELDYTELLVPEEAVYEFVYPTVVGPRYGGGADPGTDGWIENPYLKEGAKEPYRFGIQVHLETGIAIKELASPSHKVDVAYRSGASADVKLAEPGGGTRDFVLRYRLAGDQVETGVLLYGDGAEQYFLMMMEPPARPTDAQIPSREYIFLLDVSGSMHGFPLDTAKELMRNLLGTLRPTDHLNVVLFSGASYVMRPEGSLPATPANIQDSIDLISRQRGGGGTELMGGLRAAYSIPKQPGVSRTVVVVTDGYVGVEAQTFKFIREHLDEANLFAFGIGSSVNRHLIEGMARAGLGEPLVVLRPEKARAQADRFREYIRQPVLAGIGVAFRGLQAHDVAPGKLPDLMARRPLILFGKYQGGATGSIEITGTTGAGPFRKTVAFAGASQGEQNSAVRYLWARKWVELLDDELAMLPGNEEVTDAITNLGLTHGILTRFTSFVAIDSEVVNRGGKGERVKQPLPLPDGVSNLAVGGGEGQKGVAMKAPARMQAPGHGYGRGGGGARAASPRAEPAPAPAESISAGDVGGTTASTSTRGRRSRDDADKPADRKPARVTATLVSTRSEGLSDAAALIATAERALRKGTGCAPASPGTLVLRLTVDASGKVTRVQVVKGTGVKALDECLRRTLLGLTSTTRPTATSGTLDLTLQL